MRNVSGDATRLCPRRAFPLASQPLPAPASHVGLGRGSALCRHEREMHALTLVQVVSKTCFHISRMNTKEELPSCVGRTCPTTRNGSSKELHGSLCEFRFSTSLPTLLWFIFLISAFLSTVVMICISSVAKDVESLYIFISHS